MLGLLPHEKKTKSVALLKSTFSDRHIYVTLEILAYIAIITSFIIDEILIRINAGYVLYVLYDLFSL